MHAVMSRAWIFQDHRQKKKLGERKCPWSLGWLDPDDKRRSKRIGSKSLAEKERRKLEGQLAAGIYQSEAKTRWQDFRQQYEAALVARTSAANAMSSRISLDHFERICRPQQINRIGRQTIDEYVATRRKERGAKKGSTVSVATVNRELRHVRAAINAAAEYGYCSLQKVKMLKEPQKLVTYVSDEHFELIYKHCDVATKPAQLPFPPGTLWQALLVFLQMTGWRIGETLALRRDDIDLVAGTAITRADTNKGKRDDIVPLHPLVVDHLRRISSFEVSVFPWPPNRRELWNQFHVIQQTAGIHLPCREKHEHSAGCHLYGFHDLRRAFATCNAASMSADALQKLMRHKSYSTTQRYINLAGQLNQAVENLHVPKVLRNAAN